MDDARGGADVGVGVGGDIFLDEVDEARFALQQAEQLQRAVGRGFDERRRARLGCRPPAPTVRALFAGAQGLDAAANWPSAMIEKKVPKAREILLNKEGLAGFMEWSW
jgi:hypothetical protein